MTYEETLDYLYNSAPLFQHIGKDASLKSTVPSSNRCTPLSLSLPPLWLSIILLLNKWM